MTQKTDPLELLLKDRNCPVCHKTADRIFLESNFNEKKFDSFSYSSRKIPELMHFRLLRCNECHLVYASPAPTGDWLEKAYVEAAYDSEEESTCASHTYIKYLNRTLDAIGPEAHILDIGTGNGSFLKLLKENGFSHLQGIEPSKAPILAAAKDIQPMIKQQVFNSKNFQPESFDLITSFMTLEHADNPMDICSGAHQILKPDGILAVVVHNHESWLNSILKTKSPIYDIEHLQLFSKSSIVHLMEKAGFEKIELLTITNQYFLSYFIRLIPFINPKRKKQFILLLKKFKLSEIRLPMFAGNMLAIGYKRKKSNND